MTCIITHALLQSNLSFLSYVTDEALCYVICQEVWSLILLDKIIFVFVPQRMCATSSARPQCTTTFPSTGTVSSSDCTLGTTARRTSATSSSPSSCRYVGYIQTPTDQCQVFHFAFEATIFTLGILVSSVFFSFFLGAAAGACTPGIRPKGQRQEWRHLLHGLQ